MYGVEAIARDKVEGESQRIKAYDESRNNEGMRLGLDMLEEVKRMSHVRSERYKSRLTDCTT